MFARPTAAEAAAPIPLESEPTMSTTSVVTCCRDGHDKTYPGLQAVYHYGMWSTFSLMFGYTALPRRIDIVCPSCGALFSSITDRKALEKFRYREPRVDER
jgi:hypothetical protein